MSILFDIGTRKRKMSHLLFEFKNVALGYHHKAVLSSLNFAVCEGDFLGIVGPNGAGKSTLLKGILGLLKPLEGKILFDGKNGQKESRPRFGYVPQRGHLDEIYPLSVAEIVMMGRYAQIGKLARPKKIDFDKTRESLAHLGIAHLADVHYGNLSGGQKQRALIARALVSDPTVLILDEPTEGLDMFSQHGILDLIRHFHREHHLTVIMVSHHLDQVANYVKKIALMEPGFFQIGSVEEILTEKNLARLYNMPIKVATAYSRTFIIPGESHD